MWPEMFVYMRAQILKTFQFSFSFSHGSSSYGFNFTFIFFCMLCMTMGSYFGPPFKGRGGGVNVICLSQRVNLINYKKLVEVWYRFGSF